jgi:hypothetical protein
MGTVNFVKHKLGTLFYTLTFLIKVCCWNRKNYDFFVVAVISVSSSSSSSTGDSSNSK